MPQVEFNLSTLNQLDFGKLDEAFAVEVRRCVADCHDRPLDDKGRTVGIVFTIVPKLDSDSMGAHGAADCTEVIITAEIASKVPTRRSRAYVMKTTPSNELRFAPDSPDAPDQLTLDDELHEKQAARRQQASGNGRRASLPDAGPNAVERALDAGNDDDLPPRRGR